MRQSTYSGAFVGKPGFEVVYYQTAVFAAFLRNGSGVLLAVQLAHSPKDFEVVILSGWSATLTLGLLQDRPLSKTQPLQAVSAIA